MPFSSENLRWCQGSLANDIGLTTATGGHRLRLLFPNWIHDKHLVVTTITKFKILHLALSRDVVVKVGRFNNKLYLLTGIGYAMLIVTFIVAIYYNVLMSYTIFYIAASFQAVVPWSRCDLEWANPETCIVGGTRVMAFLN